jgi:hypothetical protein
VFTASPVLVITNQLRRLYAYSRSSVPVPPLPLQHKFAAVVERVERLRAVQREALRQAEHLFTSLLDRALSG